ncbi:hypothetical protein GE107_15275 [Cohnella sp. CFH 77786]|uniref:hypothetical protein n=1 Tax=Cohnella sp. CFH 77786 TaxID=2662265 RepID=UPI001C60D2C3|nr:hypothetical protein [Cohnella sp. CFH 77786]MBW5447418.1 hypothetical protein [Cohnella sp. CFH 77786]
MRVPSFERFRKFSAAGAFFVCGMVVGAAAWNGLESEHMNQVMLENLKLKEQLTDSQEELKRVQSDTEKGSVIQSIMVFVQEPEGRKSIDAVTEKELKKRIKDDLSGFRGRSIYHIGKDAQFAGKILENKVYTDIGENDYDVRITTILVADAVLQVWVEAQVHLRP